MARGGAGIVAAGHPLSAEAGARVLREGGNAVDAAIAAMLTSWVAEPLLSGPGAGGYMLVAGAEEGPVVLAFFVQAPRRRADPPPRCALLPREGGNAFDATIGAMLTSWLAESLMSGRGAGG